MSQITLTNLERQTALEHLLYNEREAQFICLAALHGGYFLRRQYAEFLGTQDGGTVTQLIEKVIERGHVEVATYRANTHLYHLAARPFYAAIGEEDNRNRRRKEPVTIKTKLMGLDFILAHQDRQYLATEREKVGFFERTLGIERSDLPAKRYACKGQVIGRYFVEKFPLFVSSGAQAVRLPVATFSFIDPGQSTLLGFETFLGRYTNLFAHLREFEVIYVATSDRLFEKARLLFEQKVENLAGDVGGARGDGQQLFDYFKARQLYDTRQLGSFDRDKLIRLRDCREAFSSPEIEALYERWKTGGNEAVLPKLAPKNVSRRGDSSRFSTFLLEHSYDLFGSLTAY